MNSTLPYVFTDSLNDTKLLKASRPFKIVHSEKSKKASLLLHGYMGYPGELVSVSEALYSMGYDIFVPLLPGHGTNGKDFLSSTSDDWLKKSEESLVSLLSEYERVVVVGHSMGGSIMTILLSKYPEIYRAVLCCPGYSVYGLDNKTLSFLKFVSLFKKRIKKEWHSDKSYRMHYEDAPLDDEALGKEYWSYIYPKQLLEFDKIRTKAIESISKIETPTLIIKAKEDSIVYYDDNVSSLIEKNNKIEVASVDRATHYIYYDKVEEAEEKALLLTKDFFKA